MIFRSPLRLIFLSLLLVLINGQWSIVNGQSPSQLYQSANAHYKAAQYDQAAAEYEKLISQGNKTAEVFYNLGNSYYKLNNIGKSILNYERALKLAPEDEDIQHNLKLANAKITDKIQAVPQLGVMTAWSKFVESRSAKAWALYAIVFIWLAFIGYGVYFFLRVGRRIIFSIGPVLIIVSLFFASLAYLQNQKMENSDEAILLAPNAFVKSAPDANGNDLFLLHEGVKFEVLDHVSTWNKIRLADGKQGWIEKGSFERI